MAAKRKPPANPLPLGKRKPVDSRRRCQGKNKAGERCGAPKIGKGVIRDGHSFSGKFCINHEPDLPKKSNLQSAAARVAGPRSERSLRRQMREKLEQRLSEEYGALLENYLDIARNATRAVVVPGSRDEPGYVQIVANQDLQLKGMDSLFDRVLGKATATNEIILPGGETDTPPEPPSRERLGQVADILQKAGAIGDGATPTRSRKKDV